MNKLITVTVAGIPRTLDARVHYKAPNITSITPYEAPTNGGSVVTLKGEDFGVLGSVVMPSIRHPLGSQNRTLQIIAHNHTTVQFVLLESYGGPHEVRLLIEGQYDHGRRQLFKYSLPHIDNIVYPYDNIMRGPMNRTIGNYTIKIEGTSFGPTWTHALSVQIGGKPCAVASSSPPAGLPTNNHNAIFCQVPRGQGEKLPMFVDVVDDRSNIVEWTYGKPHVDFLRPNRVNALGERVGFIGWNYGFEASEVHIIVGNNTCSNADHVSDQLLECTTPEDTVGYKNLTVHVAGQMRHWPEEEEIMLMMCHYGYYGQFGEYCTECPIGAICPGKLEEPYSIFGWWRGFYQSPQPQCSEERFEEKRCWEMLPCMPQDSCLGNNTCDVGYTGYRCAECIKGKYYRIDGRCRECPQNMWMIPVVLGVVLVGLAVGGYYLNKKRVNLAFLAVGEFPVAPMVFGFSRNFSFFAL